MVTVLPIQYREFKIDNGLNLIRTALFVSGITVTLLLVVSSAFLVNYSLGNPLGIKQVFISSTYSFGGFFAALMLYLIYNYKGGEEK